MITHSMSTYFSPTDSAVTRLPRTRWKTIASAADYGPVGSALLDALAQGLGSDFTDEARTAWTTVYQIVADTVCAYVAKR